MKRKNNEQNTEAKPLLYGDHKAPVTRRDFLASGLVGMSALAFSSTTLTMMSNAFAQSNCGPTAAIMNGNVPFLCLDCAGGMNIAGGNALVGQTAGQMQGDFGAMVTSDYRKLGIPDEFHPGNSGMTNNNFGLKFHSSSGILEGLTDVLSPRVGDTQDLTKHVDGLLLCGISNDDTQGNPINTAYMAQKAGAIGQLVQIAGTRNSVSGGNSIAPSDQVNLTLKPSQLTDFSSSEGLLSIGQSLMGPNFLNAGGAGGKDRLQKFMELLGRAGTSQQQKIASRAPALAQEITDYQSRLSGTSTIFNKFSPSALNPVKNPTDASDLEAAYGKPLAMFSANERMSSNIINLITRRTVGSATIAVGGGDYHDGTASTGHRKDVEMGRYIGWAIRVAAARGVPMFIHLFSDGSVVGDATGTPDPMMPSRTAWMSDSGERSSALMIVYHPKKVRTAVNGNDEFSNFLLAAKSNGTPGTRQIGYFKPAGGNVVDAHSLSNNVSKLWIAVILNYMATLVNSTDDDQIRAVVSEQFRCKFGDLPSDWEKLLRLRSLIA